MRWRHYIAPIFTQDIQKLTNMHPNFILGCSRQKLLNIHRPPKYKLTAESLLQQMRCHFSS